MLCMWLLLALKVGGNSVIDGERLYTFNALSERDAKSRLPIWLINTIIKG